MRSHIRDYYRDPSSGDVYYKGRWYDDPDELEAAEDAFEHEQELKADLARDEQRGSEDRQF